MKSNEGKLKSIERKFAYVFCAMRILIDLLGAALAIVGFSHFIRIANSPSTYFACVLFLLFCFFVVGADIHYIIFRDIRHIRNTHPDYKDDVVNKNKIEF